MSLQNSRTEVSQERLGRKLVTTVAMIDTDGSEHIRTSTHDPVHLELADEPADKGHEMVLDR